MVKVRAPIWADMSQSWCHCIPFDRLTAAERPSKLSLSQNSKHMPAPSPWTARTRLVTASSAQVPRPIEVSNYAFFFHLNWADASGSLTTASEWLSICRANAEEDWIVLKAHSHCVTVNQGQMLPPLTAWLALITQCCTRASFLASHWAPCCL